MWNFNKIKKSLQENGYYEFKNYLSKSELEKIKKSLVETLNYIHPSNQKDLQKKYYGGKKKLITSSKEIGTIFANII